MPRTVSSPPAHGAREAPGCPLVSYPVAPEPPRSSGSPRDVVSRAAGLTPPRLARLSQRGVASARGANARSTPTRHTVQGRGLDQGP
jgi:hypothetical protein